MENITKASETEIYIPAKKSLDVLMGEKNGIEDTINSNNNRVIELNEQTQELTEKLDAINLRISQARELGVKTQAEIEAEKVEVQEETPEE